ncbi:hypothetical protein BKA63DRAFT_46425 [Paraphoma chrysanthemicola]|nr:hypothetical protein BKA63DRAFT_46425 [Paraphoma chrysanthemicola]
MLIEGMEANTIEQIQLEEDLRLFGTRNEPSGHDSSDLTMQQGPTYEGVELVTRDVRFDESRESSTRYSSTLDSSKLEQMAFKSPEAEPTASSISSEPPIYAWLVNTEPPKDPNSAVKWREAEEVRRASRRKQNFQDLEVFRNVEIGCPFTDDVPTYDAQVSAHLSHTEADGVQSGAYMLYRNIRDQYPNLGDLLAWRFARMNWKRMEKIQTQQHTRSACAPSPIDPPSQGGIRSPDGSDSTLNEHRAPFSFPFASCVFRNPGRTRKLCSLPPPPRLVSKHRAGSGYSAECHLCHQTIYLRSKRDWSNHVMDDLLPYMCPIAACASGEDMYARRRDLSAHLRLCHPLASCHPCPFCGKSAEYDSTKHIGHHMEEIAFGVLSTAYEQWSYDDTDSDVPVLSARSMSPHPNDNGRERFFCTDFPPCQLSFTKREHLSRHIRYVFRGTLKAILIKD